MSDLEVALKNLEKPVIDNPMHTLREILKAYCGIKHPVTDKNTVAKLVEQIDALPEEEKIKQENHIKEIKRIAQQFYDYNSKDLSGKLISNNSLVSLLNVTLQHILAATKQQFLTGTHPYKSSPPINIVTSKTFQTSIRIIPLKSHSILNDSLLYLISNLHSNVMDSSLNAIIQEFFDITSLLIENEGYHETLVTIESCFVKHGWEKNNFVAPPNRKLFTIDLQEILNRMLMDTVDDD